MGLIVYLSDLGPLSNPCSRSGGTCSPSRFSAWPSTTGPARSRFRPSGSSG